MSDGREPLPDESGDGVDDGYPDILAGFFDSIDAEFPPCSPVEAERRWLELFSAVAALSLYPDDEVPRRSGVGQWVCRRPSYE